MIVYYCILFIDNDTYHRTIKMIRKEASKKENEEKVKKIFTVNIPHEYSNESNTGDYVRISLSKNIFEKSYSSKYTEEIFLTYDIKYSNVLYFSLNI